MPEELPIWLPFGFEEWNAFLQGVTLALLTFVSEDLTTIGAGLLATVGKLTWTTGYLGCFLGIWIGDMGLYGIARGLGRPLLERPWAQRFINPEKIRKSEEWFAKRGLWILVACRFLPGTRFATYVSSGFLRVPFRPFALITGICAAAWTVVVFLLARSFGAGALILIKRFQTGGWILIACLILAFVLIRFFLRLCRKNGLRHFATGIAKTTRWEFWPPWIFYVPVVINYCWLSIRFGSPTLPTVANPGFDAGGFVGESKYETLEDLSETQPQFTAHAKLIPAGSSELRLEQIDSLLNSGWTRFPFILKPDQGQRGVGVKLIQTREQIDNYLQKCTAPLVMQTLARGEHEAGIFYYRFPGEERGRIFAITHKEFPTLTGDGIRTLEELVWSDPRAKFMANTYLARFKNPETLVPANGEIIKLVTAGNHAQGCIFRDGWRLYSVELEARIDEISKSLRGFFIGRYDVRYESEEELMRGENFEIIELNGATSEATSIYDPDNSLGSAYRTLFQHWKLVFQIANENRKCGQIPISASALWRKWREFRKLAATYPSAD